MMVGKLPGFNPAALPMGSVVNADQMINLNKPHLGNIVKRYALQQLLEKLVQDGLI